MPNMVFDLVDPAELIDFIRAYNDEVLKARFTLNQVLPDRVIPDLEYRVRAGGLTDVDVAEFRPWDIEPTMVGRPGISRKRGELAPVSRQIPLLEEQSLRLRMIQRDNNPIVNAIYDDAARMIRSVVGRIELARGDVLTDGILTINEHGVNLAVDYGVAAGHLPVLAGAAQWTLANVVGVTPTAKPISDLLTWLELYVNDTGVLPRGILMSRTMLGVLAISTEVKAYAQGGLAAAPARATLSQIQGVFADQGIPPLIGLGNDPQGQPFYDVMVRVNGVATRVIPADRVVFVPPVGEPVGNTFWGLTAEALFLVERNLIAATEAPGVVAVTLQNESPVQTFTVGTAIALPAIINPELIFTADVA